MMMMMMMLVLGTKLTEYKVNEEAVANIAMEVGVAKREAEIVCCVFALCCSLLRPLGAVYLLMLKHSILT